MTTYINQNDIKSDSVENWVQGLLDSRNHSQMTDEQSEMYIKVCLIDDTKMEEMKSEIMKLAGAAIFITRTEAYFPNLKVDIKIPLFISSLTGSPGSICMYVYMIAAAAKKYGLKEVKWEDIGMKIFMMGFPSEEVMHKFWDEQKVAPRPNPGTDNLIDYLKASQSLNDYFNQE